MLEVQKFLQSHTLEDLTEQYGIKVKRSEEYPELVLLKYSQLDSPMGERIVQECRGLILNEEEDYTVVSRPFDKFFNHGEGHAAEIDWTTARLYNKLDGSLIGFYWYKGKWNIQTSGHPDASGPVLDKLGNQYRHDDGRLMTFKSLTQEVMTTYGMPMPHQGYSMFTYMFELCTEYNRTVVVHKTPRLVLIAVRNRVTGEEHHIETGANPWPICESYPFNTIENVVHKCNQLDPIEAEGYIIADRFFNRIKLKNPGYVALSHLCEAMGPRSMLEIVRTNEQSEFLTYYPEYKPLYEEVKQKYTKLLILLQNEINHIHDKFVISPTNTPWRDIGIATKGLFYQGVLFTYLRKGKTFKDILFEMPIKKLETWIEKV